MRCLALLLTVGLVMAQETTLLHEAETTVITGRLQAESPQPDVDAYPVGKAMTVTSLAMRTTLWGPPDRPTISLMLNDVWDRRQVPAQAPTLAEITAGAFAPANRDLVHPKEGTTTRPASLGWLVPEGGYVDPWRTPRKIYSFPCPKPVGQVILHLDGLAGAGPVDLTQSCADGTTRGTITAGNVSAQIEYVLGIESGVIALRVTPQGLTAPPRLRLYRHRDTSHLGYLADDGVTYTVPDAAAGAAWNGPIAAPEAGNDGGQGWIRQVLPADPTFPAGFTYAMVAGLRTQADAAIATGTRLGTPPPTAAIATAPGAAVTLTPVNATTWEAVVVVATSTDGPDPLAEARRRLEAALAGGFASVQQENRAWLRDFYAQRETTRVIAPGGWPGESVADIYRSRTIIHGGGTRTDLRRYQASAHYAAPEVDNQPWHGMPCYNEIFYTYRWVHGWTDAVDLWKQIVQHCQTAAERQAQERFGLPGMLITHGYQPPSRADRIHHNAIGLELCLGTMAQLLRPLWDEWDYGGDERVLREEVYPPLRQAARFYAAYPTPGANGRLHIVPSVIEECWGITPEFRRNRDGISSLCQFRWLLHRAAAAADLLGVDAEEAREWRRVAAALVENPTWESPLGTVLTGLPGEPNVRYPGDHPWEPALKPIELADEITLDSPDPLKALGLRTASLWQTPSSVATRKLLGQPIDLTSSWAPGSTAEALLNSRGEAIHLFPAVPPGTTVAFRGFRSRGGFTVAAQRDASGVGPVTITAARTLPCVIADAWPGSPVTVTHEGQTVPVAREGGRLRFAATAGQTYRIVPGP